jgi:hypothetical protein
LGEKTRFEKKVKHSKNIDLFKRVMLWWQKLQKIIGKLEENTKKNGKESFNGTPKPNSLGCCQKERHKIRVQKFWKENK